MIDEYWPWLRAKSGRKIGYKLLINKWLLLDIAIALALSFGLKVNGFQFAEKALFPAASVLAGMAFAWTSRASAILNNKQFRDNIISDDNPLSDYVYGFQMAIMILFACVIYIAIMAVGGFRFYIYDRNISMIFSAFFMYFMICLTIRECWSVVNFTNLLTLLDDVQAGNSKKN